VRRQIQALDPDLIVGSGLGSLAGPQTLSETVAFLSWNGRRSRLVFASASWLNVTESGVEEPARRVAIRSDSVVVSVGLLACSAVAGCWVSARPGDESRSGCLAARQNKSSTYNGASNLGS
jgi:hypothetical protein